jgi:hypothetical protein
MSALNLLWVIPGALLAAAFVFGCVYMVVIILRDWWRSPSFLRYGPDGKLERRSRRDLLRDWWRSR